MKAGNWIQLPGKSVNFTFQRHFILMLNYIYNAMI